MAILLARPDLSICAISASSPQGPCLETQEKRRTMVLTSFFSFSESLMKLEGIFAVVL